MAYKHFLLGSVVVRYDEEWIEILEIDKWEDGEEIITTGHGFDKGYAHDLRGILDEFLNQ